MDVRDQRIGLWCGPAFVLALGLAFLIGGFIPPPSPSLSMGATAALYREHAVAIRMAMLILIAASGLLIPFAATIYEQLCRMRPASRWAANTQLTAAAAGTLVFIIPAIMIATASFRAERDPALVLLLGDLGWLNFITPFSLLIVQFGAIGYAILGDRGAPPVFPRWLGFYNLWMAVLLVCGGFAFFAHSGAFAWNGLLPFWVAAGAFFSWFFIMTVMLAKAIARQRAMLR